MQSDWKRLYKLTAERTGKSEQTYKDVGNFVFQALNRHLRRPKSLITKLKGIGYWYLRKNRMEEIVKGEFFDYTKPPADPNNPQSVKESEDKREIYDIFVLRLQDYDQYLEQRKEIRRIRNESQTLLEPDNGEK